ncbi:MAG: glycosyltransferase [Salinivirgaceae bacterium]|nr:glycosyltransferase [Salinivirgaceae bacterium]MDD4745717.1 glycosyltransferase [Salinivirgaceae bacterium]MDY0280049.1 glycosyltransferase [Salinivirgaceae bacterium]
MLSVCIPVFNTDIRDLVSNLSKQAVDDNLDVEIRVYDDRSHLDYRKENRIVAGFKHVIYNELQRNIGRAAIRNKLALESEGTAILFMDGDMQVINSDYLQKYYNLHRNESVIVGGIAYQKELPGSSFALRWKYGHLRESIPADQRQIYPYRSFMTGNVLIPKQLMIDNPFDEQIVGYGHEDTKFGYQIRKLRYPIIHIDNALMHGGIETSKEFLFKTKVGIENLVALWRRLDYPSDFASTVRLLKTTQKFNKFGIRGLTLLCFNLMRNNIEKNLHSNDPKMRLFDFYKLGLTLQALREIKSV